MASGVDALVALLGVVKAGAAYLPAGAGGAMPVWSRELAGSVRKVLTEAGLDRPDRDGRPQAGGRPDAGRDRAPARPSVRNAACVLAVPDGVRGSLAVVLEHRQLVALALDRLLPPYGPADRVALLTDLSAPLTNAAVWWALAGGAEIVVLPSSVPGWKPGADLRRRRVTTAAAPAEVAQDIARRDPTALERLRTLRVPGVDLPTGELQQVLAGFRGRLFSVYGAAETGIVAAADEVTRPPVGAPPVGRPLAGSRLYVLDEDLHPVPEGRPGWLFVGGTVVSRGYLGRPDRTADGFLPDPFHDDGGRVYATGHQARRHAGGRIEYLGRPEQSELDGRVGR
jgi:non-ribosomal peptide synthetase component F